MSRVSYESLLRELSKEVDVIEYGLIDMAGDYGYFADETIFIEKSLSEITKKEVLLEEYGHFKTTVGNILDQSVPANRKQERQARNYAYGMAITLDDIIDCYQKGIKYYWECAEYLDFSEEFVYEAVKYLRGKLGEIIYYKNYIISFLSETLMHVERKKYADQH